MSPSAPTERKSGPQRAAGSERGLSQQELAREFSLWMLAALKLEVHDQANGTFILEIPEECRAELGGCARVRFVCGAGQYNALKEQDAELKLLAPGSPLFAQMLGRLCRPHRIVHAFPLLQPLNVHQLTPHLLGAYRFGDGTIHLGGCTLEDRPILRMTYVTATAPGCPASLHHIHTWPDGCPVDEPTIAALGLLRLVPPTQWRPRTAKTEIRKWLQAARERAPAAGLKLPDPPLAETVIWCKYAQGKIVLVSGDQSAEIPFAGWAQDFASQRLNPPPLQCSVCGKQSYHVATIDDGRITVAEAIETCDVSGKRVICTELETCAASGRRALSEYLDTCPLTDERILATVMETCALCRQRVNPVALKAGRCLACRRLQRVSKDDSRLGRILGEYPGLDRWRRWRLSETSRVFILVGRSLRRQILVVLGRESLEPLHVATAGLFLPHWNEILADQADRHLR